MVGKTIAIAQKHGFNVFDFQTRCSVGNLINDNNKLVNSEKEYLSTLQEIYKYLLAHHSEITINTNKVVFDTYEADAQFRELSTKYST